MEFLKKNRTYIEDEVLTFAQDERVEPLIKEAMVYILQGGKKLRASLLIEMVRALDEEKVSQDLVKIATAIEMVHAYSLVHDDLPALDNDDYRRGKLTLHKRYNEAIAILAGDSLLTHAFTYIAETSYSKEMKFDMMAKFADASGPMGMVYGQMMDMEYEVKDLKTLKKLHSLKTGRLLTLPIELACLITETERDKQEALLLYAKNIGISFQAMDDLLDVIGNQDKVGKTLHKDELLDKMTYTDILGIEGTKQEIKKLTQEAISAIKKYDMPTLEKIAMFIGDREY